MPRIPKYINAINTFITNKKLHSETKTVEILETTLRNDKTLSVILLTIYNNLYTKTKNKSQPKKITKVDNKKIETSLRDNPKGLRDNGILTVNTRDNSTDRDNVLDKTDDELHYHYITIIELMKLYLDPAIDKCHLTFTINDFLFDTYTTISQQQISTISNIINNKSKLMYSYKLPTVLDAKDYKNIDNDLPKLFIKNNNNLLEKFNNLKCLTKDTMLTFVNATITPIIDVVLSIIWILSKKPDIDKIHDISCHFAMYYKIYDDFSKIEHDIISSDHVGISTNYIVNFGISESYDQLFVERSFIEEFLRIHDIRTNTLKEIIKNVKIETDAFMENLDKDNINLE